MRSVLECASALALCPAQVIQVKSAEQAAVLGLVYQIFMAADVRRLIPKRRQSEPSYVGCHDFPDTLQISDAVAARQSAFLARDQGRFLP